MRAPESAPSWDWTRTSPASRGSMPAMMLSNVLLPQPEGPTMLAKLPQAICRLKDSITGNSPCPLGVGNFLHSPSITTACDVMPPSNRRRPPRKDPIFPGPQDERVDGHHQQHETRAPRQHHVGAGSLKPVHQFFADAPACPEVFAHERDFPRQREADAQRGENVRHQLREQYLAQA